MNLPGRATPRDLFLSGERRLEVFFYTSSVDKFLHASTVFSRSGVLLREFRSTTEPYTEDYSAGKARLLTRAIKEILGATARHPLFFVEDTSLRIDALSEEKVDYPGLSVKEWFANTTFDRLDADLRRLGRGREATIKSDIALHVPGLARPLFFHGEVTGRVADSPPDFTENPQYPWLTPRSFNGWFIPDGTTRRLGEMTLEESWQHDFRTRALEELINRLEEYAAILNLPSHSYSRSRNLSTPEQLFLLPERAAIFIVVGKTCAGKTTFGERASQEHGFSWVEASAMLRTFKSEYDDDPEDAFEFAKHILDSRGADIVAHKILESYSAIPGHGLVITGFRTIEEVEAVKTCYEDAQVVLIDAGERSRYQRHLARGRLPGVNSLPEFRAYDSEQWSFGLLRVAEDLADVRVVNEGTLADYWEQIDSLVGSEGKAVAGISRRVHPRHDLSENQIYRCLLILNEAGRSLSCDEIEALTTKSGSSIRHNNVNKVLKRVPELAKRFDFGRERVRYEITNAGRAYIRYMKSRPVRLETSATVRG
jgi:inosine/xanthosine triphosphate pyrophosphatase family protein/dephospho-CoA kinase